MRGHEIKVIDYEIDWQREKFKLYSKQIVLRNVNRIYPGAQVTVIRPGIIKIRILDYLSLVFTHYKAIQKQVKQWKPDIIIGGDVLNSYLGARLAKKFKIPFIFYWLELSHLLIPITQFRFLGKMIEKTTLKYADTVLAISESLKKAISDMGFPINRIHVLESGVSINQYNLNNTGDLIRKYYNINKDDHVLIFVGYLYHFSGLKEVCIELSKLNDSNIKLLIVGEGEAYKDLEKLRSKYKLENNVILAGQKPLQEIPRHLAAADICILPAYNNETMRDIIPGKIYEYMAAGKPVISTSLPGMINKFGMDNGIAFVHQPEDVLRMAIELINSDTMCKQMGLKARGCIEQYSWDSIADEFEKILKDSIKKKKSEMI
ncbi:MAG: glycosyltransferase family 4 protein [Candidatus Helarchaeota archaeon]|nr:glycosyltransferase family 4 protein [Candidatus Helarchaeota archaeon]